MVLAVATVDVAQPLTRAGHCKPACTNVQRRFGACASHVVPRAVGSFASADPTMAGVSRVAVGFRRQCRPYTASPAGMHALIP